jgi:muramoyltetrapeptide carboxypeptidase LdcA involved in peptidoglycan recycling
MQKPTRLKRGDTIAIVALSWGGHHKFPHIVDKGIERLEKLFDLKVKRGKTLSLTEKEVYENPQKRADDLHEQLLDKNVHGIISLIGGEESSRVLKYLDKNLIKSNFKFFMGYSDTTTFHTYFNQIGLVTFNGPSIMAGLSESLKLEEDFVSYFQEFLFGSWNEFEYKKFKRYTNKYLPWNDPENLIRENTNYVENNDDWHFIQGEQTVEGELFGGCIEVLEFLKGTIFWPNIDFWNGKILFFETSEDKPPVKYVTYWLRNYGVQGVFERINGILFGRARDYTEMEKQELEVCIKKVLKEFGKEELLVVTNMDFGHTDPQLVMPNGIKVRIHPKGKSFKLIESIWKG